MPERDEVVRVMRSVVNDLASNPDVTGVSVTNRVKAGKETDELVIRVYVRNKRPLAEVPEALRIPPDINGIKTDVMEKGPDLHTGLQDKQRPVQCGLEIGVKTGVTAWYLGTAGCFVRKNTSGPPASAVTLLTAAHVLYPEDAPNYSDVVYQPGPSVFSDNSIGLKLSGDYVYNDTVDAGLVSLDDGIGYSNYVLEIGSITGTADANPGDHVKKTGRTTGFTSGTIRNESPYSARFEDGVWLNELLIIDPEKPYTMFCDQGDSGAPLINDAGRIVGLVIAKTSGNYGNNSAGTMCTISNVFEALNLQLADLPVGAWYEADLIPGAAMNSGFKAPGSALATLPWTLFYLGADTLIHTLYNAGQWWLGDPTTGQARPAAAPGSALATLPASQFTDLVFYLGTEQPQHVHVALWSAGQWSHLTDLTTQTGAQPAATGSALAALSTPQPQVFYVFYIGTDKNLHSLSISSDDNQWKAANLTGDANVPVPGTALATLGGPHPQVFYIGTDTHVHMLSYQEGGSWTHADFSHQTNATVSPAAGSALATASVPQQTQVFYVGTNDHVYQLAYDGSKGWPKDLYDDAHTAVAPQVGSGLATLSVPVQQQVFYVGTDSHVHMLHYDRPPVVPVAKWSVTDLSAQTNASVLVAKAGSALATQRSGSQQQIFYVGDDQHVHTIWYQSS
jgi:Trypsin